MVVMTIHTEPIQSEVEIPIMSATGPAVA